MQPKYGSNRIRIPVTFDSSSRPNSDASGKIAWVLLLVLLGILLSSMAIIGSEGIVAKLLLPILIFFVLSLVARYLVFREVYFRDRRKELKENNYLFSHNVFWNAYEVNKTFPYFVQLANGSKCLVVEFEKAVIVGKDKGADFQHYEAISTAYQQLFKKGIECIHVDYMDTVGGDSRMKGLFELSESAPNKDVSALLTRLFDNVENIMNHNYTSYDVYCFYFNGKEDVFWDELQVVLQHFKQANYSRMHVLDKDSIRTLVMSTMNIDDFSIGDACETLYKDIHNNTEYLRSIWTEKEGVRTILNKTMEESEEAKRVTGMEHKLKKTGKRRKVATESVETDEDGDMNLFN